MSKPRRCDHPIYHYLPIRTSSIIRFRSLFGRPPVIICGIPLSGMNSRVGTDRTPNTAASSCSRSISTGSYKGQKKRQRPSVRVIWGRFPKFVVGFVAVSLLFSLFFAGNEAAPARTSAKMFSNTLFNIAFVCIGLETRFRDIFSKENRRTFWAFMTAQMFNIVVTLIVAYLLFGVLKPYLN